MTISSDKLEQIKKMHESLKVFVSSLEDIAFAEAKNKDNNSIKLNLENMETFCMLSIDASAIIMANCLNTILKSLRDKKEEEGTIKQMLEFLNQGIKVHLTDLTEEKDSQPIN